MKENPLVSVVIPTYNRSALLLETLESLHAQDYRPIEVNVVDDGSTDDTEQMITAFNATSDPDFQLNYMRQANAGPSAARNRGTAMSKGKYIYYFDSDDLLYPQALSTFVTVAETTPSEFVVCGFESFDSSSGQIINTVAGQKGNQMDAVLRGKNFLFPIRCLMTLSLAEANGPWDEIMKAGEDRLWLEQALCSAKNAMGIEDILVKYRHTEQAHRRHDYNEENRWECEQSLAQMCWDHNYDKSALSAHFSRVLKIGLKLAASGDPIYKRYQNLAKQYSLPLNRNQKVLSALLAIGPLGGMIFSSLRKKKRK